MAANQQKTNIWIDGSQAGATLTELKKKVSVLNKEIRDLPRNSDEYKKKVEELKSANAALGVHRNAIKSVSDSYKPAQAGIKSLISQFSPMLGVVGLATAAIGGVVAGIKSWYTNNKEMEKSLSSLKSLTGASANDIKYYKEQAIEMAKTSTMSASQTVEAFKLIGSARPDLLKDKEALAAVTKETIVLAEAAEMDLGVAAQSLAGSMNQFNLGAEHSGRIINALAAGSKAGASEIEDVTQSIDKFGTVAAANNVTFEESVALTELMGEKNIKGAEAGTQLRNVLLNVATASALPKEALDAMQAYGVDLSIVTNKALPLKDRLTEMSKVQGDQNALLKIFGKENVVAGQTILGNIDKFDKFTRAVTGTNTAYEQQAINNDNLDGDLKKMSSAWEGVTLSMGGTGGALRQIVQWGTDFLKWITLVITAFSEWDMTKIQTSIMHFLNFFPGINSIFGEFLDAQIRFNQVTSSVIDGMKKEADSATILTSSLKANNAALASGNLSAEETKRIQEENAQIISTLNQKYPEFTKNLDLNKASGAQLNKLQKEITKDLIKQSIATVQAAEAERILTEIVQNSMKIAEKRRIEAKRSRGDNFVVSLFSDSSKELEAENKKLQKDLKQLPKFMKEVEKEINSINPQFGEKFKIQSEVLTEAYNEAKRIRKELETATGTDKQALQKQLEAQWKIMSNYKAKNKELKDEALKEGKKQTEQEKTDLENGTENQAINYKKRTDAQKKQNEERKKLAEELDKLIKNADKIKTDLAGQKRVDSASTDQQKEVEQLVNTLDEKYKAEIDAAEKLMFTKGEIGKQALEQYNLLTRLKTEERAIEEFKIEEKYSKISDEKQKADAEKALEIEKTLQQSIYDLKVAKARTALAAIHDGDVSGYRYAKEELEKALDDQLQFQNQQKAKALEDQKNKGIISEAELINQKLILDEEYNQKKIELENQTAEELKKIDNEKLQNQLQNLEQGVAIAKQFANAASNNQLKTLKKEQTKEEKILKEKLNNKTITEEEYTAAKTRLDNEYAQKKYELDVKQFKQNQAFAVTQAIIQGALAIAVAWGTEGPAAPFVIPFIIASTGAQLATIAAQQPPEAPQFAEGGYTDVIGQNDGLRYRAKKVGRMRAGLTPSQPSLALVSEKGPEYFVPHGLLRDQRVARHVAIIDAIRTNQYADGGYTAQANFGASDEVLQALKQNTLVMNALASQIPNMNVQFSDKNITELEKNQKRLNKVKN